MPGLFFLFAIPTVFSNSPLPLSPTVPASSVLTVSVPHLSPIFLLLIFLILVQIILALSFPFYIPSNPMFFLTYPLFFLLFSAFSLHLPIFPFNTTFIFLADPPALFLPSISNCYSASSSCAYFLPSLPSLYQYFPLRTFSHSLPHQWKHIPPFVLPFCFFPFCFCFFHSLTHVLNGDVNI